MEKQSRFSEMPLQTVNAQIDKNGGTLCAVLLNLKLMRCETAGASDISLIILTL